MKKFSLWSLIFLLIFAIGFPMAGGNSTTAEAATSEYNLALFVGSPLTISEEVIKPLDSDNPNVAPIIYKNRTLVPLRAIAEHFGAKVSYVAETKAAVIEYGNGVYTFYAGKNYYTKAVIGQETQRITYDTEMLIRENRSMVPLRVICENVLNKTVEYSQSIITVSEKSIELALDAVLKADIRSKIGQAIKVSSLAQLQNMVSAKINSANIGIIKELSPDQAVDSGSGSPAVENGGESPTVAPSESPAAPEGAGEPSPYSTTNNQVEGIDEADIVKTDGKFIYVAGGNTVKVIKADNGKMTLADTIKMPATTTNGQEISISELYIDEGRLVILGSFWQGYPGIMEPQPGIPMPMVTDSDGAMEKSIAIYPPIWQGKNFVYCGVYSVDASGKTSLLKEVSMEGSLLSSRKSGDTLYIMSNKYFYNYATPAPGDIIPMYRDTAISQEYKELPLDRILCYPESISPQYLMIAAIDIRNTEAESTIEAILGSGTTVYMNAKNLYIAQEDYSSTKGPMTFISKFSINGTKIGFAGGGKVKGTLLNQFSMDEFDGNLRVATTGWDVTTNWGSNSSSSVYVLDANLNLIGSVENMAPGERIYAVRFMGEKGYIVTFRQIDPLFVLDLADPTAPVITGELKVPGFSNFLYPVGENLLLGVGQGTEDIYSRDTSGREIVIGTRQTGIKFSLFDVSDQGKPKELHTITVGDSGSYSEILYNHKALMFHPTENILAFDATVMDADYLKSTSLNDYFNGAVVLSYDKQQGFDEEGRIAYKAALQEGTDFGYYMNMRRLCTIGNVLYYIQDSQVRSFNMDTLAPISQL